MMKRAGLCSVTFRNLSVAEIINLSCSCGLAAIEWGSDVHVPQTDPENAETVGKMTRDAGLVCSSYGSYFRCGENEDFESYSLAAEKLGAQTIRIWAGTKNAQDWDKLEYGRFVARVRDCCKIAEGRGQTLAFEYHHGTFNNSAEYTLRLLQDSGKDNIKTYWQPAYWQDDEQNDVDAVTALRGKIAGVHVYCWKGSVRYPLETGQSLWRRYASEIGAANYYLEFIKDDSVEQLRKDAKTLRERILV